MKPLVAQWMVVALATLGGFVDAIGYLAIDRLFVAFMSGNSTMLGISILQGTEERSAMAGGLVAMFVAGVMLGTWVGGPFGPRRAPVVLVLVGVLLAGAGGLSRLGLVAPCCLVVALAMGAENTVFQTAAGKAVGLTYVTGTLVRLAQRLTEALAGGRWMAAVPDLALWAGLVGGAGVGAAAYRRLQLDGLWIGAAVALVLAGIARAALTPSSGDAGGDGQH